MAKIEIPYGKGKLAFNLEDERIQGVLRSEGANYKASEKEEEIVRKALENPIGTERLRDLAEGKKNIVVITSDHTRRCQQAYFTLILKEIREKIKVRRLGF